MATVRISSDWGHPKRMEWCGAPTVDVHNHVDRSVDIPEDAYHRIESGIVQGYTEGIVFLDDGSRFEWFLDRSARESPHKSKRIAPPTTSNSQTETPPAVPMATALHFCPQCGARLQKDQTGESGTRSEPPSNVTAKSGGWVLAEFPVAKATTHGMCPDCGEILVQTNPVVRPKS